MQDPTLYLAIDFDGVLHPADCGPHRTHCTDYGAGKISCEEFIRAVNKKSRENAERFERRQAGELFDRAQLLIDSIDKTGGEIRLVVATSWRNSMSELALTALLPPRLRSMVAGTIDRHLDEHREPGIRGRLMEKWIAEHAPGAAWLAVDDVPELWEEHLHRLFNPSNAGIDADYANVMVPILTDYLAVA